MRKETLATAVIVAMGIEIPTEDNEWEKFRREWCLNPLGEGGEIVCANALTKNLYLAVGNDDYFLTLDVFYKKARAAGEYTAWSRWGDTWARWFGANWESVLADWLCQGIAKIETIAPHEVVEKNRQGYGG